MEACGFRELNSQFKKANTVVVGVSKDSIDSHNKFADKFKLPYVLLSDPQSEVMKKYGAFGKKMSQATPTASSSTVERLRAYVTTSSTASTSGSQASTRFQTRYG